MGKPPVPLWSQVKNTVPVYHEIFWATTLISNPCHVHASMLKSQPESALKALV